jgi:hypothetical protein
MPDAWRKHRAHAARRQRAYYRRTHAGRGVLRVEVDLVGLAQAMIDEGLITPDQEDDRQALARALERIVAGMIITHQAGLEDSTLL